MKFRTLALAAIVAAGCAAGASAQTTLASDTVDSLSSGAYYVGQSFQVAGSGSYDNINFSWLAPTGAKEAEGNLYLFDSPYVGSPNGLASAIGGSSFVGEASASNGSYLFSPSTNLNSNTEYYAYSDRYFFTGFSQESVYPEGSAYLSRSASANFGAYMPTRNSDFIVTGTAVSAAPEPATWAMMIFGLGLVGGMMWRQRRQSDASRVEFAI